MAALTDLIHQLTPSSAPEKFYQSHPVWRPNPQLHPQFSHDLTENLRMKDTVYRFFVHPYHVHWSKPTPFQVCTSAHTCFIKFMTEQGDIVAGPFPVDPIDVPRNDEVNKDCQRSPGTKIGAKLQIIAKTNSTCWINRRSISWLAIKKCSGVVTSGSRSNISARRI